MELLNPMSKADYPAYSVAYTGTAGSTTAWPSGPQGVVVWSDQACYVEVGVGGGLIVPAPADEAEAEEIHVAFQRGANNQHLAAGTAVDEHRPHWVFARRCCGFVGHLGDSDATGSSS